MVIFFNCAETGYDKKAGYKTPVGIEREGDKIAEERDVRAEENYAQMKIFFSEISLEITNDVLLRCERLDIYLFNLFTIFLYCGLGIGRTEFIGTF